MIEAFQNVPPADMANLRVSPAGYGIAPDAHDISISVHGLIAALATTRGMAASPGKLGGSPRSEAKRMGARAKGGRPRKVPRVA